MSKLKILFIINPVSGGKKKDKVKPLILQTLDSDKFIPEFAFTQHVGHAIEITAQAISSGYQAIIAVGGDGTINEVAGEMIGSDKLFGIIPFGSGNGLARFLKIPLKTKDAIALINKLNFQTIDTAEFNSRKFVNMAGIGFDAQLSAVFANNKGRGLKGYLQQGIKEIIAYKPQNYQIIIDGVDYSQRAFAVSIANSSQYGNNVYISPKSSLTDGLLDVCIIHPLGFWRLMKLSYQMITAKTDNSSLVTIIRGENIKITRENPGPIHLDGEAHLAENELNIQIKKASLKVIVGQKIQ
jgi:YegS/Rv2252/BmrU family lipid kinase